MRDTWQTTSYKVQEEKIMLKTDSEVADSTPDRHCADPAAANVGDDGWLRRQRRLGAGELGAVARGAQVPQHQQHQRAAPPKPEGGIGGERGRQQRGRTQVGASAIVDAACDDGGAGAGPKDGGNKGWCRRGTRPR